MKIIKELFTKIIDTIFLFRPTLMIPVWTIIALGWITGTQHTLFTFSVDNNVQLIHLFLAFTFAVGFIYILNQIADIEGDTLNNKLFILPGGHLTKAYAYFMAILSAGISLYISILYLDRFSTILMVTALILGVLYSAPPFSLKDRPWGALWGNWLGHGVVTYLVGWYGVNYGASIDDITLGIFYSLTAGFANGAVYLTSTIPDIDGDKMVGKKTFAVVYGEKKTALMAAVFVTISAILSFFLPYQRWIMVIPAIASVYLFWKFAFEGKSVHSFKTFRWPVLFLSAITTLYIPMYAVIVFTVVLVSHIYYKKRFNLNYPSFNSER